MRGKTDISGFDYHDGNQVPAHVHEFTLAVRADDCVDRGSGGTRYNTNVPFQAGCRLPFAGEPGAKELMTAVRVSKLDGMFAPQPLTLRASCLKAPRGAFVL
jgi:hypothetical protein